MSDDVSLEPLREAWERWKRERGRVSPWLPTKTPTVLEDPRPRYKPTPDYPLGYLKDEKEDLLERLDRELAAEPTARGAKYAREHQHELDRLEQLLAEDRKKARTKEGLEAGGGQKYYEKNRAKLAASERRRAIEAKIEALKHDLTHLSAAPEEEAEPSEGE